MDIRVSQYMSSNHGFSLPLTWEGPYLKKDLSINSGTVVFSQHRITRLFSELQTFFS